MQEILSKLRKYEIKIRKAINTQMKGNFHSVFKGAGLEFSDVRDYIYGDDVRRIDWNVSAKGEGTYVKEFKEEKEQTVFFLLDVSASLEIGKNNYTKLQLAKEICGVLMLSAVKEDSHIGLICFSDQKEKYIKPKKGLRYGYEAILNLFNLVPASKQTNLEQMLAFSLKMLKRRCVIILVSDFIDENYLKNLQTLAQKHDLVIVHVYDTQEVNMPSLGIIPVFDNESGKTVWLNTSSPTLREELAEKFETTKDNIQEISKKLKANYIAINTEDDFVAQLIKLFRVRRTKGK